jgi:hypothetical protein
MRSVGVPELLVIAVIFGFVMAGFWSRIFAKAGYSRWLALTIVIPLVNLAVLGWFAFSAWPVQSELDRLRRISASTKT